MNETLTELENELLKLRQECYFNRGVLPTEEWREYHPRIDAMKKKILLFRFALAPSIDRIIPAQAEAGKEVLKCLK